VIPREECQFEAIRDTTLGEEVAQVILDDLLFGSEAISNFFVLVRLGDQADDL
jgi:hypothetical protein